MGPIIVHSVSKNIRLIDAVGSLPDVGFPCYVKGWHSRVAHGESVVRRGAQSLWASYLASWEEVAGLSNEQSSGTTKLRPQREEGADVASHQTQLYKRSASLIFWRTSW